VLFERQLRPPERQDCPIRDHGPTGRLERISYERIPTTKGLVVHIPRSKADQAGEGQTVTALKNEADPTYCPVRALSRWRRAASIEEGPLFRGVRRDGRVLPEAISYKTLNRLVKRACREAGLEPEGFQRRNDGGIPRIASRPGTSPTPPRTGPRTTS